MANTQHHETVWNRLSPLLAAFVPGIVAIWLLSQHNTKYGPGFTSFVNNERTAVQIIVQFLSQGLGVIQIYSLRSYCIYDFRLRAFKRPSRIEEVGLWSALRNGAIDLSLAPKHYTVAALVLLVGLGPSALWAGALTPLLLTSPVGRNLTVEIPSFSQSTVEYWNSEFVMEDTFLHNEVDNCVGSGLITTCPVPNLQGSLIGSASSASTANGASRKHSKIDSSDWSYLGRSYGVGASLGLVDLDTSHGFDSLQYTDYGYLASVDCIFNSSSNYKLISLGGVAAPTYVYVYETNGSLPNSFSDGGVGEGYGTVSTKEDGNGLLVWSARSIAGLNYISIAAGADGDYGMFDKAQCQVEFNPSAFSVTANMTSKTIIVEPKDLDSSEAGSVPNVTLTVNTINSINLLSRMMSSAFYTSTLGDALQQNLNTVAEEGSDSAVLESLQDSFTAMVDDIMVAYGASQISLAKDTVTTHGHAMVLTSRIGSSIYINISAALTFLLLIFLLIQLVRTRLWTGLEAFDPLDVRSVMVAASAGGFDLADRARATARENGDEYVWSGKTGDEAISSLRIRFRGPGQENHLPAIVPADQSHDGIISQGPPVMDKAMNFTTTTDMNDDVSRTSYRYSTPTPNALD